MKVNPHLESSVSATDVSQVVALLRRFLEKLVAFGPHAPKFIGHVRTAIEELRAAQQMISDHFGGAQASMVALSVDQACDYDGECKRLLGEAESLLGEASAQAEGTRPVRDLLNFLLQNPQLIQLLLSWFAR